MVSKNKKRSVTSVTIVRVNHGTATVSHGPRIRTNNAEEMGACSTLEATVTEAVVGMCAIHNILK